MEALRRSESIKEWQQINWYEPALMKRDPECWFETYGKEGTNLLPPKLFILAVQKDPVLQKKYNPSNEYNQLYSWSRPAWSQTSDPTSYELWTSEYRKLGHIPGTVVPQKMESTIPPAPSK